MLIYRMKSSPSYFDYEELHLHHLLRPHLDWPSPHTNHDSRLTNHATSNRYTPRLKPPITPSKQTAMVLSNRDKCGPYVVGIVQPLAVPVAGACHSQCAPRGTHSHARISSRSLLLNFSLSLWNRSGLQDRACSPFYLAGPK